jgi:hypothetical protein
MRAIPSRDDAHRDWPLGNCWRWRANVARFLLNPLAGHACAFFAPFAEQERTFGPNADSLASAVNSGSSSAACRRTRARRIATRASARMLM